MPRMFRSKLVRLGTVGIVAAALASVFAPLLTLSAQSKMALPGAAHAPTFEVATVRPNRPDAGFENYQLSDARFHTENAPLTALMRFAFDVRSDDQLPREPAWIASEKFDIDAKVDDSDVETMGKLPPDQKLELYRLMLQALLEERFQLRVSKHSKELPVYALIVARGGPKLAPSSNPNSTPAHRMPTVAGGSRGALKAGSVSMDLLARWLSGREDMGNRVVIDETGLTGTFDFTLNWSLPNQRSVQPSGTGAEPGTAGTTVDSSDLSIFTALQEQLGLKLESRKAPVEVLVIDHVERPSPN